MRGFALMQHVLGADADTREQLAATLDKAGLEWMEADLANCPAATKLIQQSGKIGWVPVEVYSPNPDEPRGIVLHADMLQVTFASFARRSSYHGYAAEGSPASWAVELGEALETCWRPSTATRPWRR